MKGINLKLSGAALPTKAPAMVTPAKILVSKMEFLKLIKGTKRKILKQKFITLIIVMKKLEINWTNWLMI
jgi:hypothetical protein